MCFEGTIGTGSWGAIYNLTFNDDAPWDATSYGVTGFELDASGLELPAQLQVIFTDNASGDPDTCRLIQPGPAVSVPFSSAHPDCESSGRTPVLTGLRLLRIVFPAKGSAYEVDFCLRTRALP